MSKYLYRGSVKTVERVGPGHIGFRFGDDWSAFDVGKSPQPIRGKGQALYVAAVASFKLAQRLGIRTHFVEAQEDDHGGLIIVEEAQSPIFTGQEADGLGRMIGLECIRRRRVSGSLLRDLKGGRKKATEIGFATDEVPAEGTRLPKPTFELTTKWEPVDRKLTVKEALEIGKITFGQLATMQKIARDLDDGLEALWAKAGFAWFDGKVEFILNREGDLAIADVFGTPDEDRPVLLEPLERGRVDHYGKEFLRQALIEVGYKEAVDAARAAGQSDPPYPVLPDVVLNEASRRYSEFSRRIAQASSSLV